MNYYDIISKSYNELHKKEQLEKLKIIKKNAKIIPPLLDIGCGTGVALEFFNIEPSYGIDSSKEMLKLCKNKNVTFGKAENLPFKDKTFNTIISLSAIQNFNNMEKAITEMKRVSKNNNIIISIPKKSKKVQEVKKILKEYFTKIKKIEQDKDIIFFTL